MIDAIDRLARASADQLHADTSGDAEAGLVDLHVRQARHRRRTGVAAAAAVVVAAGLGIAAGVGLTRTTHADRSPAPTSPVTSADSTLADPYCVFPRVECLGDRTYQFALVRPVRWAIPPGFGVDSGAGATSDQVESYRSVGPTAGVTVLERVRPSSPDGTGVAPGVTDNPRAFVGWVASRPFLDAGRVRTTTLDGREAWQVRVTLGPDLPKGPATCTDGFACYAIVHQRHGVYSGIWGNMAAEYTALRLPGGGTTVVWSWIFTGNPAHLGTLEEAVHGMSWPND
jgi:hypothetical protein